MKKILAAVAGLAALGTGGAIWHSCRKASVNETPAQVDTLIDLVHAETQAALPEVIIVQQERTKARAQKANAEVQAALPQEVSHDVKYLADSLNALLGAGAGP